MAEEVSAFDRTELRQVYWLHQGDFGRPKRLVRDIEDMHRASLIGGNFSIFELEGNYCMSFLHNCGNKFILFYGYHMTEEQYLLQIQSWGNTGFHYVPMFGDNQQFRIHNQEFPVTMRSTDSMRRSL